MNIYLHTSRTKCLPLKLGERFMVESKFFGKIHEGLSCMRGEGLMIESYQRGRKSFANVFSSNLSNVKIMSFSVHLILIIDILFEKLTPQKRG